MSTASFFRSLMANAQRSTTAELARNQTVSRGHGETPEAGGYSGKRARRGFQPQLTMASFSGELSAVVRFTPGPDGASLSDPFSSSKSSNTSSSSVTVCTSSSSSSSSNTSSSGPNSCAAPTSVAALSAASNSASSFEG